MRVFTVSVPIMVYTDCLIKSPGSAISSLIGLLPQPSPDIILDVAQDFTGKLLFCPLNDSHSGLVALLYGNVEHKAAAFVRPSQQ